MNGNKPKEIWKGVKSLDLSSDKARKSNIYLEKDLIIQFKVLEIANIFKTFYSLRISWRPPRKTAKSTQQIYMSNTQKVLCHDLCNVSNNSELSNVFEKIIKKILLSLDTSKPLE